MYKPSSALKGKRKQAAIVPLSIQLDLRFQALRLSPLRVCLRILASVDGHTGEAFPSVRTIAQDTRLGVGTVKAAIDKIEASGLMSHEKRWLRRSPDGPRRLCNVYRFHPVADPFEAPAPVRDKAERAKPPRVRDNSEHGKPAPVRIRGSARSDSTSGAFGCTPNQSVRDQRRDQKKESCALSLQERVDFEKWWEEYPHKTAQGPARDAYREALQITDAATLLKAALDFNAAYALWPVHERRYAWSPAKFLNDRHWKDGRGTWIRKERPQRTFMA